MVDARLANPSEWPFRRLAAEWGVGVQRAGQVYEKILRKRHIAATRVQPTHSRDWSAGVAKIMAEVRRREADRALPEPPFYSSDNPLDGTRLWDNS